MKNILFLTFVFIATFAYAKPNHCILLDDNLKDSTIISAYNNGYLYQIQPEESKIGFSINTAIGRVDSVFEEFKGGVLVKEDNKPIVMVVNTESLITGNFFTTATMKGEELFASDEYPTMVFEGTDIVWETNTTGYLDGKITIRGQQKNLRLKINLIEYSNKHIMVVATAVIDRTKFGMHAFQGLADKNVELYMEIKAVKI